MHSTGLWLGAVWRVNEVPVHVCAHSAVHVQAMQPGRGRGVHGGQRLDA